MVLSVDPAWKTSKKPFLPASGLLGLHAGAPELARNAIPGAGAHGTAAGALEAASQVRFLAFLSRFRTFFHLKTPMNLK